jgi:hypothetical protein
MNVMLEQASINSCFCRPPHSYSLELCPLQNANHCLSYSWDGNDRASILSVTVHFPVLWSTTVLQLFPWCNSTWYGQSPSTLQATIWHAVTPQWWSSQEHSQNSYLWYFLASICFIHMSSLGNVRRPNLGTCVTACWVRRSALHQGDHIGCRVSSLLDGKLMLSHAHPGASSELVYTTPHSPV